MKISFIIPVYNIPQDMLDACLASLPSGHEVIVMYDTRHEGLSIMRNRGIEQATGDYIQFVDADDALLRPEYDNILNILEREQPDMLSFCFSTTPSIKSSDSPVIKITTGRDVLENTNLQVAAWGYLFRRDILGELRFAPGIQNEDERFTPLLYLQANKVVSTNIRAYFYRQREGSLQHTYDEAFIAKRLNDYRTTIRVLENTGNPVLERRTNQMRMDYFYNHVLLTGKAPEEKWTGSHRCYTLKYWIFSYLASFVATRWLLTKLIQILPKKV